MHTNRGFLAREVFWTKGKMFSTTSPEFLQLGFNLVQFWANKDKFWGKNDPNPPFWPRSMARCVL
jgi:hypothetical protein